MYEHLVLVLAVCLNVSKTSSYFFPTLISYIEGSGKNQVSAVVGFNNSTVNCETYMPEDLGSA